MEKTAGIAFAIKKDFVDRHTENLMDISERIIIMRIEILQNRNDNMINVYAPTMTYPGETSTPVAPEDGALHSSWSSSTLADSAVKYAIYVLDRGKYVIFHYEIFNCV